MKKVKLLLLISAIAIVPTQTNAQMAVTDPTGMANDIVMFFEKMKNAMEQSFQLGEQSISVKQMLEVSQQAMEAITTVSKFVAKDGDINRFKQAAQRSTELLKIGKEDIMRTDYDAETKLRYIQGLLNNVNKNVQLCNDFIQMFSAGNKNAGNLTDAERTDMKEDALEEVEANNRLIEMEEERRKWEDKMAKEYKMREGMATNALFFNF